MRIENPRECRARQRETRHPNGAVATRVARRTASGWHPLCIFFCSMDRFAALAFLEQSVPGRLCLSVSFCAVMLLAIPRVDRQRTHFAVWTGRSRAGRMRAPCRGGEAAYALGTP